MTFDNTTMAEVRKVMKFCAAEVFKSILVNEGEARCRNNQRLTDMTMDMLDRFDMNKMLRDELKRVLRSR